MLAQRFEDAEAETPDNRCDKPDAQAILTAIGEVTYEWDLRLDRLAYGPNAGDVLRLPDIAPISTGRGFAQLMAPESPTTRYDAVVASAGQDTGSGVAYHIVYGLVGMRQAARGPSPVCWIEDRGCWFAGPDGRPVRAQGVMRDITERYEADRLRHDHTRYDALTGALHRAPFIAHTAERLDDSLRKGGTFAILLAGLDHLFTFNRTYGYDLGDELIAAVGVRIRNEMRSTDLLARYAGNKFALFLENCDQAEMQSAARRILGAVEAMPFLITAGQISANLHIGGVIAPEHGRTMQAVLRHAEEALEAARQATGERYAAYAPSLSSTPAQIHSRQVCDEIVAALNQGRVALALQPVVDARTHAPVFYEGLLRLDGEDGRLVTPAAILPIAEESGLIQLIDQRMLELGFAELTRDPGLRLSLNVSGTSLLDPQWLGRLQAACANRQDLASRLIIEMTETSAISDLGRARRTIAAIKNCGAKVAMDDFGAGHTSFRNLRNLQIDLLKLDGAFVQNLASCEDDRAFVRTLVDLARHLGIPTVAEWVEDAASAAILADWGVDYLQGHFFGAAQAPGTKRA